MQEDITLKLLLDANEMNVSLGKARAAAMGLGGATLEVSNRVDALRAKQTELTKAIDLNAKIVDVDRVKLNALKQELEATTGALDRMGGTQRKTNDAYRVTAANVTTYKTGLKGLQEQAGKAGAVVTGLSGALGASAGSGGQFLTSLSGIGGALLAGGPVLAGMAALAASASYVAKKFEESQNAADAAFLASLAPMQRAAEARLMLEKQLAAERAKGAVETVRGLAQAGKAAEEQIEREIAAKVAQRKAIGLDTVASKGARRAEKAELDLIITSDRDRLELQRALTQAKIANLQLAKLEAAESAKASPAGLSGGSMMRGRQIAFMAAAKNAAQHELDVDEFMRLEIMQRDQEALAHREAYQLKSLEIDRQVEEMRIRDLEAAAARHKAIAQGVADFTMQAIGGGVSATQGLVDGMITGQEHALEAFASNVARQAGSALIGYGIQLEGAAVVSALTGLLPLAAVQAAGGAGLIATGVGLGGAAAALDHVTAGGTIGQKLPEKDADRATKRDRGLNGGRSGSSSGGGGNTIVNISANYGLGVAEEHTQQHLADMLDKMVHRGITPRRANIGGRR